MIRQPYANIRFDWLGSDASSGLTISPSQEDLGRQKYLLPNGYGEGFIETLSLSLGMTMVRAEHRFEVSATGHTIRVGDVKVEMNEPTFQAQIMRGGRVLESQIDHSEDLLLSPGIDLFRYSERYHIVPSLDGSNDSEMTCLSIGHTMLESLIGIEETNELLGSLDLTPSPRVKVRATPLYISAYLHSSMNPALLGATRKLNCQARALDYLTALLQYLKNLEQPNSATGKPRSSDKGRKRSQRVHEYLMSIEGKLPTLDVIATQFGGSARLINDEFAAEYGESIYTFITNQRLLAAHELIRTTDVALKGISYRLGYAHVNHFITAFRKKFGYPPGSLRRKSVDSTN